MSRCESTHRGGHSVSELIVGQRLVANQKLDGRDVPGVDKRATR
jgi:hypothetical protein